MFTNESLEAATDRLCNKWNLHRADARRMLEDASEFLIPQSHTLDCAPGYQPAFDTPTTYGEALAWVEKQGDPTCMTFDWRKAEAAAKILRSCGPIKDDAKMRAEQMLIGLVLQRALEPDTIVLNWLQDGNGECGGTWWPRRRRELEAGGYEMQYEKNDGTEVFSRIGLGTEIESVASTLRNFGADYVTTPSPAPGSLSELRLANTTRQAEWCVGTNTLPDLSFRGNELAGEVGEACNEIKKLERERLGWRGSRTTVDKLATELADVIICTDLVAMSAGIDLEQAVRDKFNETSAKVGLKTRL